MIVPDLNLLIYAHNDGAPQHDSARQWWEGLVNGVERIGVPWVVSMGFVRLMTHPRALAHPVTPEEAVANFQLILDEPMLALTVRRGSLSIEDMADIADFIRSVQAERDADGE